MELNYDTKLISSGYGFYLLADYNFPDAFLFAFCCSHVVQLIAQGESDRPASRFSCQEICSAPLLRPRLWQRIQKRIQTRVSLQLLNVIFYFQLSQSSSLTINENKTKKDISIYMTIYDSGDLFELLIFY